AANLILDWRATHADLQYMPKIGGYYGLDNGTPVYLFSKGLFVAGLVGLDANDADLQARGFAARLYPTIVDGAFPRYRFPRRCSPWPSSAGQGFRRPHRSRYAAPSCCAAGQTTKNDGLSYGRKYSGKSGLVSRRISTTARRSPSESPAYFPP